MPGRAVDTLLSLCPLVQRVGVRRFKPNSDESMRLCCRLASRLNPTIPGGARLGPQRAKALLNLASDCFSARLDPLQALCVLGNPGRQVRFTAPAMGPSCPVPHDAIALVGEYEWVYFRRDRPLAAYRKLQAPNDIHIPLIGRRARQLHQRPLSSNR